MSVWKKVKISDFLYERKGKYKPNAKEVDCLSRIEKIDFQGNFHIGIKPSLTNLIIVKNSVDLGCADLRNADLRGADLLCADLSGADLRCADLSGADLRGGNLRCADLSGAEGVNITIDLSIAELQNIIKMRPNKKEEIN